MRGLTNAFILNMRSISNWWIVSCTYFTRTYDNNNDKNTFKYFVIGTYENWRKKSKPTFGGVTNHILKTSSELVVSIILVPLTKSIPSGEYTSKFREITRKKDQYFTHTSDEGSTYLCRISKVMFESLMKKNLNNMPKHLMLDLMEWKFCL